MTQIPPLQKNDTVAIVSTARKISFDEIRPAIELLKFWNLNVKIGKSIGLENHQFAGTDEERTSDLQTMLDDPEIKAIWCARGGYGTVRIIDRLGFSNFKKKPKWIIGYSDVTVLHSQLNLLGFESLHAQMAHQIDQKSEATRTTLKNILFGKPVSYEIPFSEMNKFGHVEGEFVGGNLSVLYSLLRSPSAISTRNKVLFLEDLDEYLYHIDRMLQNLKRNGVFKNLNGLIIGGMSDMNDNQIPFGKTAEEIIWESVKEYDFPVCFGFPAGHVYDNQALVFGRKISMEITLEKTMVNYLE
ncbi:MAG TPA: LD-carboxypeptidase [Flavobacteriaceae bacterium]|nr:LD-carboxypeptidase [Flavobacteriaceae bacterium]